MRGEARERKARKNIGKVGMFFINHFAMIKFSTFYFDARLFRSQLALDEVCTVFLFIYVYVRNNIKLLLVVGQFKIFASNIMENL